MIALGVTVTLTGKARLCKIENCDWNLRVLKCGWKVAERLEPKNRVGVEHAKSETGWALERKFLFSRLGDQLLCKIVRLEEQHQPAKVDATA